MTERYRATLHDRIFYCDYLLSRTALTPRPSMSAQDQQEILDAATFLTELRSEYRHALHELALRKGN